MLLISIGQRGRCDIRHCSYALSPEICDSSVEQLDVWFFRAQCFAQFHSMLNVLPSVREARCIRLPALSATNVLTFNRTANYIERYLIFASSISQLQLLGVLVD